jgi:hypothetical protein
MTRMPVLAVVAPLLLAGSLLAAEPEPPSAGAESLDATAETVPQGEQDDAIVDDILITGRRYTPERIRIMLDFVNELGDPVNRDFGFARFEERACFRVHNTAEPVAKYIQDRMADTARLVNLEIQPPNCRPNVDIIFSTDGRLTATQMVETRRALFKPFGNAEGTTQDSHALSAFKNGEQPVRWWQITVPVDRMGNPVVPGANPGEPPRVMASNSLLASGMRDRLLGSLIIVDVNKLGSATWDQLADYLAMVALVQVDPKANLAGFDSILNLFGGNAPPSSLTEWDRAYLQSLYKLNLYMLPRVQKGQLAQQLLRDLDGK